MTILVEVHTTQKTTFVVPGTEDDGRHSTLTGTYQAIMAGHPVRGAWGALPFPDHAPGEDDLEFVIFNPVHVVFVGEITA